MNNSIDILRGVITLLYTLKTFDTVMNDEVLPIAIDSAIRDIKSAIKEQCFTAN